MRSRLLFSITKNSPSRKTIAIISPRLRLKYGKIFFGSRRFFLRADAVEFL
jgi:hypothetical protein